MTRAWSCLAVLAPFALGLPLLTPLPAQAAIPPIAAVTILSAEDFFATANAEQAAAATALSGVATDDEVMLAEGEMPAAPATDPVQPAVIIYNHDPGGGPGNPFSVAFTATDRSGNVVRFRSGVDNADAGSKAFGFAHACYDHNMCSQRGMQNIVAGSHRPSSSDSHANYHYRGYAVVNGEPVQDIRVVVSFSNSGPDGNTPDGAGYGMITAFCQGASYCPDYINNY
jgi:hypothetical protein